MVQQSINAKRVARDVSETIRRGKKVVLGEIIRKNGYSLETSLAPQRVTETLTYKTEMERLNRPIIEGLQRQINKFKAEIESRKLSGEDIRVLVGSLDIYIKNFQLLSGGATERQVFVLPSEIMSKNDIEQNGSTEPQKDV
jgi:hypothetical protein